MRRWRVELQAESISTRQHESDVQKERTEEAAVSLIVYNGSWHHARICGPFMTRLVVWREKQQKKKSDRSPVRLEMKLSKEEPLKAKEKAAPTLVASSEGPFGAGRVEVHTLQVCWHASNQEDSLKTVNLPILTCDMATGRLVTGGGDNCARLWRLERKECGDFHARFLATLSGHEKSVNAVRFSSCGKYVATGGDDGLLLVWILDEERSVIVAKDESDEAQEVWRVEARTHLPEDVYDISWAPRTAELIGLTSF